MSLRSFDEFWIEPGVPNTADTIPDRFGTAGHAIDFELTWVPCSGYELSTRNYNFAADLAIPEGLPPGTPMFKDVNNLSYRQIYTTRTY
jgi:hypothetical protein